MVNGFLDEKQASDQQGNRVFRFFDVDNWKFLRDHPECRERCQRCGGPLGLSKQGTFCMDCEEWRH